MSGYIRGISGPTVHIEMEGLKLYERVFVGHASLTGEVVRLDSSRAVVQVYENTRGLGIGDPVRATGAPLMVRLGPGLLHSMFDGLQRPLVRMKEESGDFITASRMLSPLDESRRWTFHPLKDMGDMLMQGEAVGYVHEGALRHFIPSPQSGRIGWIHSGDFCLNDAVASLEDGRKIYGLHEWPVRVPRPYKRKRPSSEPLITGQRCLDLLFPLAKGGTAVMPGGFGTGKTVLEQAIAKFSNADIVVYVGCGERGNEMAELIEEFAVLTDPWTSRDLMDRTVLVVNTSNMPVAAREASIYTATTIAEYYRDMGYHVLLLADSLSRWAEALREISSSLEEMPGEEGYPTYLASRLSGFFERGGVVETTGGGSGSLSMVLSVSPPGGDFTEPVTQACLRNTGVFLMLDTQLAHRRHFPAINWFQSYSLYEKGLSEYCREKVSDQWEGLKKRCREILRREESLREVVEIIGSEGLQDTDRLTMSVAETIRGEFLCQNSYTDDAFSSPEQTISKIREIVVFFDNAVERLSRGEPVEEVLKLSP